MRNSLDTCYEITKLIKLSPRRDAIFQRLKDQFPEQSPGIRILCPTRWTIRAQTLNSIISNYQILLDVWEESKDYVKDVSTRSRIIGVSLCMKSFDFFFGVALGELILNHSDNLSKTLQSPRISAADGQALAEMTVRTLQTLNSEDTFKIYWIKLTKMASDLD